MHAIYELKEKLCDELEEYGEKKLDAGTLDVVDKLAHTIKNLDKIIESYEDGKYSGNYMYDDGMAYEDGMSYRDGSYERGRNQGGRSYAMARGRRGNVRRDSMGRYASADSDMMVHELKELMADAPDERTKMEFKKFIQKIEQM